MLFSEIFEFLELLVLYKVSKKLSKVLSNLYLGYYVRGCS
jgi:hypothetical protein